MIRPAALFENHRRPRLAEAIRYAVVGLTSTQPQVIEFYALAQTMMSERYDFFFVMVWLWLSMRQIRLHRKICIVHRSALFDQMNGPRQPIHALGAEFV